MYRARGVPFDTARPFAERREEARRTVQRLLASDGRLKNAGATYQSLAIEADGRSATVLFSADETQLEPEFSIRIKGSRVEIEVDRLFDGVTTVVSPETADIV